MPVVHPTARPIARLATPSAASNTIRARCRSRCSVFVERAKPSISTAVARWRAPGCRYRRSTSFVTTAKDAKGCSKRITPPIRLPPMSPAGCFSGFCRKRLSRSGPFRTGLTRTRNRFPQQEVFQNELPFAGSEWSIANTACYFESDGLRPRFGFDDLVKRVAAWAAEKRRCVGTRPAFSKFESYQAALSSL